MPIYLGSQPIGEVNVSFTSPDGGTNTNDATLVSDNQLLNGVTAYSKGKKIIGSIPIKTESNLTATDNIVNVPAGYYASACSKEIATIDFPEKEMAVDDNGLIKCTSNLMTGGFLSAGQKTTTLQLPVESGKTITPSSIEQTAVAAHKYTTGTIKVAAVPSEIKKITANGTYTPSSGKYFSSVEVTIAGDTPIYQDKTVNPTTSLQTILPDDGYDALSQVKINAISVEQKSATPKATAQDITPSSGSYLTKVTVDAVPTETKSVTENGTYVPTNGKWFSSVSVSVPTGSATPVLQEKSVSPTESAQDVVADAGYDGLSKVSVGAISTDYIGSNIPTMQTEWGDSTAITLVQLGFTGMDAGSFSKSLLLDKNKAFSAVDINEKKNLLSNLGYTYITDVEAGTPAYLALYLASQGSTSIESIAGAGKSLLIDKDTTFSGATDIEYGVLFDGLGKAIAATTYTPSKTQQIIPKNKWLAGDQTINPIPSTYIETTDATAAASDLNKGKTAYVNGSKITGTQVIQHYYTSTSMISNSTGNDGDIFLLTT